MEVGCHSLGYLTIEAFNEVIVDSYGSKTYPTNVSVHQIHPVKELQTIRHVAQL